jgi:hypothetical protein
MTRYRVEFKRATGRNGNPMPRRVFFLSAEDDREAFEFAKAIESVLERPTIYRDRTLADAVVEVVTREEEDDEPKGGSR